MLFANAKRLLLEVEMKKKLSVFLLALLVNVVVSMATPAPSKEIQDEFDKVRDSIVKK